MKGRICFSLADPIALAGTELTCALRDAIIIGERFVLKTLGFAVYSFADYPHKYISSLIPRLADILNDGDERQKQVQRIFNICNDCMYLNLSSYTGLEVAVACIMLALNDRRVLRHQEIQRIQVDERIAVEIVGKMHAWYADGGVQIN